MALYRLGICTKQNLRKLCAFYNSGFTNVRCLHLKETTTHDVDNTEKSKNEEFLDKYLEVEDFNYFEQGINAIPGSVDGDVRRKETVFIHEFLKQTEERKIDKVKEVNFGTLRVDRPREDRKIKTSGAMPTHLPFRRNGTFISYDVLPGSYDAKCGVESTILYDDELSNSSMLENKPKEKSKENQDLEFEMDGFNDPVNLFDQQYFELSNNKQTERKEVNEVYPIKSKPREKKSMKKQGLEFDRSIDSVNLFDQQYFELSNEALLKNNSQAKRIDINQDFIEEQNFSQSHPTENSFGNKNVEKLLGNTTVHKGHPVEIAEEENLNYFDRSFFKNTTPQQSKTVVKQDKQVSNQNKKNPLANKTENLIAEENFDDHGVYNFDLTASMAQNLKNISKEEEREEAFASDDNTTRIESFTRREINNLRSKRVNIENPSNAYEAILKMRLEKKNNQKILKEQPITFSSGKWDGKLDSKGFRILTSQTQDLQNVIDSDLVSMLCDSVLFENEDIVAINKPYGLPSHVGPGVVKSVASLLEQMATRKEKKVSTYHVVHRLDKETTGVMLLAKNERSAKLLIQMFLRREVAKVYWAITKGVPEHMEGIIDIPIGESMVKDKHRMCLVPKYSENMRLLRNSSIRKDCSKAVTHYKVLDNNNNASLIECKPESGIKHQIRIHLAMGLNTPILGDHKYSHQNRIAPQKLSSEILRKLNIRQQKVRHLSMHLHARSLVLPEYLADGRNLFISANIPPHFVENMKWLKLNPNK